MSTPTNPITPYATSPTLSFTSQELDFSLPEGGVFSPPHVTSEDWSSPQAQVVDDTWLSDYANQPCGHPAHGLPVFEPGYHQERSVPETPTQSEQDLDEKYPIHILERMGNYQQTPEPEVHCEDYEDLQSHYHMLWEQYYNMEEELMNKLMDQEEVVDKLQRVMGEQGEKIEGQERKIKSQERKLKGYEYRVRKRYNTRSGKN